jgi:hypothetical protein
MSLTKLWLAGDNLIFPDQRDFDEGHPGWGWENRYPFYSVIWQNGRFKFLIK